MDSRNMTPEEFCRRTGRSNPQTIRYALQHGTFPLGMAIKGPGGRWTYVIPREPAEYFIKTGRLPE